MLEEIVLSISTAIFFLCTAVVGSVFPDDTPYVMTSVMAQAEEDSIDARSDIKIPESFDLMGTWKSGGHTFVFKPSGRLIFDGRTMSYSLDGSIITVTSEVGGELRTRELAIVPLSEKLMKINGINAYKTD